MYSHFFAEVQGNNPTELTDGELVIRHSRIPDLLFVPYFHRDRVTISEAVVVLSYLPQNVYENDSHPYQIQLQLPPRQTSAAWRPCSDQKLDPCLLKLIGEK